MCGAAPRATPHDRRPITTIKARAMPDTPALVSKYFDVWNAHDVEGIKALHAPNSTLTDWDAHHGPTNAEVASGIAGIWKAVPAIKIDVKQVFTCGEARSCVANITVIVDATTTLNVCDVFEFDEAGLVTSIKAYKA